MIKNLLLGAAVATLFGTTVIANEHHTFTVDQLKFVAGEIQKEIKDGTIAKNEQGEAYELIGGLEVCAPVVAQAAALRAKEEKPSAAAKEAKHAHEKIQASAEDLTVLVGELVTGLQADAVKEEEKEEVFKLIGGLKMCEPVVKNVATLRAQQHQEEAAAKAAAKK